MSKAVKCDRCGQCFCPGNAEYVSIQELRYKTGDKYRARQEQFDLCLACTADFKEFLNNGHRRT